MLPLCLQLSSALAEPSSEPLSPNPSLPTQLWILEIEPGSSPAQVSALALELPGTTHALAGGPFVEVSTTAGDTSELSALPGVALVRAPWPVSVKEVTTEGLARIQSPQDWTAQGLDGKGVTIAVLDLGFGGLDELLGDELPEEVPAWEDGVGSGLTHGTAVCEILHDIAPGADLVIYPFRTEASFIAGLEAAEADGADIVSASIGFDNVWHADGSSPISKAVDAAADAGLLYVAAAGNEVGRYSIGAFGDSDENGWLELDGKERISLRALSGEMSASLRWSEPFGQATGTLTLVLFDQNGEECGRSSAPEGQNPYVAARCDGVTALEAGFLASTGEAIPETGGLYAPYGVLESIAQEGTLTLPADAEGALSIGAVEIGTDLAPDYSSQGPTDDGREKPNLAAPSQVSTATYGTLNFGGTSAATPHVAGLAALVIDHAKRTGPEALREHLEDNALDLGEPGPDRVYGAGLVQMGELPQGCGCDSGPSHGSWAWILALLLPLAQRRSSGVSSPQQ
jgi:subtilisin family serine protease